MQNVDTKHREYLLQIDAWNMMRDLAGGQRRIHAAGEKYLPHLTGESDEAYRARKGRAVFFNATWRTIEALAGMMFRKAPTVEHSQAITSMLDDVTKTGQPFDLFAEELALEVNTVHKAAVLVDHPPMPEGAITVAAAQALNLRPNMVLYQAEDFINWAYEWIDNRRVLSLAVLQETAVTGGDAFLPTTEPRWRVLDLAPVTVGEGDAARTIRAYRQRVFRKVKEEFFLVEGSEVYPRMGGAYMTEIPLEVFGDGLPPLEDLGHVNLSHYQSTADLEHGAHLTALPQPYATGVTPEIGPNGQPKPVTFHIGGGDLWMLPDPGAKFGMLEYTGQGLGALENRLAAKEKQMAVLGARMLEQQKSGVEAAETAAIHRSGEQSTLQAMAARLSLGLTRVLRWFEKWAGGDGTATVDLNRDFIPASLSAQDITALVGAWQNGALSPQELFEKFQKGGIIHDGKTYEEHEAQKSTAAPALSAPATAATVDTGDE